MIQENLHGTGVALVTPFRRNRVDWNALDNIIEYTIEGGVDYLVCLGTTGEAITLSQEECQDILHFTIERARGRLPIVFGIFGGNDTATVLKRFDRYQLNGVSAVLASSPAYNKPSQEGIYRHYVELNKKSPLPIIIYNVPGRTGSNITADTTLRLAYDCEKIIGIKEASGDLSQAGKIIKHCPDDFIVLSGDDPTALPLVSIGGKGVIAVIANAYPEEFSSMIRYALSGNYAEARELHLQLLNIHPWLYTDGNPAGIKAALSILGFCENELRLPLVPMSEENKNRLMEEMEKANVVVSNG